MFYPVDRGVVIVAGRIILRASHEAFRIDGIVESPVSNGSNGDSRGEHVVPFHKAK